MRAVTWRPLGDLLGGWHWSSWEQLCLKAIPAAAMGMGAIPVPRGLVTCPWGAFGDRVGKESERTAARTAELDSGISGTRH